MDLMLILDRNLLNSFLSALVSAIIFFVLSFSSQDQMEEQSQLECTFPLCSSITAQHKDLYLLSRKILNINKAMSMGWPPLRKQNMNARNYNLLLLKCYIRCSTGYVLLMKKQALQLSRKSEWENVWNFSLLK